MSFADDEASIVRSPPAFTSIVVFAFTLMFCAASTESLPFLQVISILPSIVENETPLVPDIGGLYGAQTFGPAPA